MKGKRPIKKKRPRFQTGYDRGYEDGLMATAAELLDLRNKLEQAAPRLRQQQVIAEAMKALATVADAAAHAMQGMLR